MLSTRAANTTSISLSFTRYPFYEKNPYILIKKDRRSPGTMSIRPLLPLLKSEPPRVMISTGYFFPGTDFPRDAGSAQGKVDPMRKQSRIVLTLAGAGLALLLASCSTIPFAQRPKNAMRVVELFTAGDVQSLDNISQVPFLFNGEIVELPEDVNTIWTNLTKSGLKLTGAKVADAQAIGPESYKRFADTMQVRVFFQKYLPKGTALVHLTFSGGSFDLLLGGAHRGYPVVIGIKAGPT